MFSKLYPENLAGSDIREVPDHWLLDDGKMEM